MAVVEDRPQSLRSFTEKVPTDHGSMFLTITSREGEAFEVFINIGKAGQCEKMWAEAVGRLISMGLRAGIPSKEIGKGLRHLTCRPVSDGDKMIKSPADGIAQVLLEEAWKSTT